MSSTGGRSVVLGSSMPVEATTSYRQYYHAIDHVLDTCEKSPPGLILGGQEVNAGKTRTEFHADWQKPFGLTDGLVVLVSTGQTSVSFAISAPKRNERFDSPERVRFVSALLRHLRQALRAHRHFAEFGAVTVELMHVIDTFPSGIAIIDSSQTVVQLNAAAARILACGDGLRLRARTVEALRASTHTQLQTSIARALDAHPGGVRTGSTLVCSRPSGKRPYVLHVHPSPKPSDGDASSPKAILVIVDLDHEAKPSPELLRSAFGLTNTGLVVDVL
jgi:PAS domain-containing protein